MAPSWTFLLALAASSILLYRWLGSDAPERPLENRDDAFPFKPDPYVEGLRKGEPKAVFGLNVNLVGPPPKELLAPYRQFIEALRIALPDEALYYYPPNALHITASALVPFTTNEITDPKERTILQEAWTAVFTDYIPKMKEWPRKSFEIVYKRPVLDTSAAYFSVEDPLGNVAKIRWCLEAAQRDFIPTFEGVTREMVERTKFKTPKIIHSTILRFGAGIEQSKLSGDEIRRRFDNVVQKEWKPLKVRVKDLRLVLELVPYMHYHLEGKDKDKVLAMLVIE